MHGNSMLLFNRYAKPYFPPNTYVLEVGPGPPPSEIRQAVGDNSIRWETVDIESANYPVTYRGEYSYPIESNVVDVVVSANVVAHMRKPWVWIREVTRICKPGGHVITITPVSWPYNENPIDCWRAYPEGMAALYEEAGLNVIISRCESLEDAHLRRHIPGRSLQNIYRFEGWKTRILTKISELLRLPVQRPYDTVTIGQK